MVPVPGPLGRVTIPMLKMKEKIRVWAEKNQKQENSLAARIKQICLFV